MSSNLPPGCNESDIPGNRPEDIAWEVFIDALVSDSEEYHMTVEECRDIWELGLSMLSVLRNQKERVWKRSEQEAQLVLHQEWDNACDKCKFKV